MNRTHLDALGTAALAALVALPAHAQDGRPGFDLSAQLTVDMVTLAQGGGDNRARVLTDLGVLGDGDLDQLLGWQGARVHFHVLDNRGGRPNDFAGTLQGVDNIEVPNAGTRLFEAWVEQGLGSNGGIGGASVLAGLYDVNSEFYVSEAASLLVAPPFGIGSEFAATGPNGPSIFPSSALAVRVKVPVGARGRVQAAVLNASARTLGDHGGIDFSFDNGLLVVAEGGLVEGPVRVGAGGWAYSKAQESVVTPPVTGAPLRHHAQGGYAMIEADLAPRLQAFARAGLSSGQVSPFAGGWQAGLLLSPALADRPDSGLSAGVHRAWTNHAFRAEQVRLGDDPARYEEAFALTYADSLLPQVGVQGDVQWVRHPGALATARSLIVTTLRLAITL